jgi:ATP-dependent Clp protease ATP-binding subunit ClpC
VSITDGALVAAATLADRYISDRFLPDKAIDLIDEAGSRMRIRRMTAPPDLREFDERIANVRRDKESAIDAQDFEKAASLRDKEKTLLGEKASARRSGRPATWTSSPRSTTSRSPRSSRSGPASRSSS